MKIQKKLVDGKVVTEVIIDPRDHEFAIPVNVPRKAKKTKDGNR